MQSLPHCSTPDEDFISFLESLKEVQTKTFDADTLETLGEFRQRILPARPKRSVVASTQPAPAPTTTPLLEALRAEKSAQKDKEAIQRNHAHYKDPAVVGGVVATPGVSRKEDTKKKTAAAPLPAKPTESQVPKKASRKATAAAKAAQQEAKLSSSTAAWSKGPQQSTPTQATSKPTPSSPTPKASRGHRDR